MLQKALSQVEKRLPEISNMFAGSSFLNLKKILSQARKGKLEDFLFPHIMESNSVVEAQYRKVYLVDLCEEDRIQKMEFLQILINSGKV